MILTVDVTSKQEQLENLKQQNKDLEDELHCKQDEFTKAQLKWKEQEKLISTFQSQLQMQRTALNNIKLNVQQNCQDILEHHRKVLANVAVLCKAFNGEKSALECNIRKVSTRQFIKYCGTPTIVAVQLSKQMVYVVLTYKQCYEDYSM